MFSITYMQTGPHDALVASTADHLAELFRAQLTFVRMVEQALAKPNATEERSTTTGACAAAKPRQNSGGLNLRRLAR